MASSIRSMSSTPSSSSSASPIPAVVDTPTDIEADFEDDETTFVKPRRGKLLSSAIGSWRNISGTRNDKLKYTRSMTCPLDGSGEESPEPNPVVNSHSTSQLPPLPPRPESTPAEPNQSMTSETNVRADSSSSQSKSKGQPIFIKRHKKYRAPPPPTNQSTQNTSQTKNKQEGSSFFKLDSKPMMRTDDENSPTSMVFCQTCRKQFTEDELEDHKVSFIEILSHLEFLEKIFDSPMWCLIISNLMFEILFDFYINFLVCLFFQMTCSSSSYDSSHRQSFRGSSVQPSGCGYNRDSSSPPSDFSVSHDADDEPHSTYTRRFDR